MAELEYCVQVGEYANTSVWFVDAFFDYLDWSKEYQPYKPHAFCPTRVDVPRSITVKEQGVVLTTLGHKAVHDIAQTLATCDEEGVWHFLNTAGEEYRFQQAIRDYMRNKQVTSNTEGTFRTWSESEMVH